jgi:hypothetical protein
MNASLPDLLGSAASEGFKVYQMSETQYGSSWRVTLQYLSAKHDVELSCLGVGASAEDAFAAALDEGRELMAKHGKPRPQQKPVPKTRSIEGLLE